MKKELLIKLIFITLYIIVVNSCSYRFVNISLNSNFKPKAICVEGIYDTSKEVIPHELLWKSLQKKLIQSGGFYLTNCKEADFILKAHIIDAQIIPYGSPRVYGPLQDPSNVKINDEQINFNDFRILTKAGSYTIRENVNVNVKIEVINLYNKNIILNKNYTANNIFWSARSDAHIERKAHFLLYEESLNYSFKKLSDTISQNIIKDLINKLY